MTHEQKKSYLLKHGYDAAKKYIVENVLASDTSKNEESIKSFEILYPNMEESVLCTEDQLGNAMDKVKAWERITKLLTDKVPIPNGPKNELKKMHFFIHKAQTLQKKRIAHDETVSQLFNDIINFTEIEFNNIIQAKVDCHKTLEATVDALSQIEKM